MNITIGDKQVQDIKLAILDKDGTIYDIHHYWCSMIKLRSEHLVLKYFNNNNLETVEVLMQIMGADPISFKLYPEGPVGVKPRPYIVKVVTDKLKELSLNVSEDEIETEFKIVDKKSRGNLKSLLKILPGVENFLNEFKKNNGMLAIATTDISTRARAALEVTNLDHLFDVVYGADLVEKTKPSFDMGNKILEELKVSPENTIMIGDHNVDIIFSNKGNLIAGIGVATGLKNIYELSKDTEYVIRNFEELKVCL